MSKYIDADELLKEASKDGADGYVSAEQIADFPTADVVEVVKEWCDKRNCIIVAREDFPRLLEVRHGKWEDPEDLTCYKCSVCGEYATQEYGLTEPIFWRYCPNCGASMVNEDE